MKYLDRSNNLDPDNLYHSETETETYIQTPDFDLMKTYSTLVFIKYLNQNKAKRRLVR